MDALETILKRRSIRKFKDADILPDTVEKVLRAAMSAPSAGNQRPWQFIVITERDSITKIIEAYPYAKFIKDVPAVIIVCFDSTLEKYKGYWTMDCSTATENILLAATGLGLGSLWLSVYPVEEYHNIEILYEALGIPEHVTPFSIIPIGYSDEEKESRETYDESRVHFEKW